MLKRILTGAATVLLAALTAQPAMAVVNVVTVDTVVSTNPGDAQCSLSEAIQNVNAAAQPAVDCAAGAATDNQIVFTIPSAPYVIMTGNLHVTRANTTIDGGNQTGCNSPCITLDGTNAGGVELLSLEASGITVKGLKLVHSGLVALYVHDADNAVIQGNYFGTSDGTTAAANVNGIRVDSSDNVTIGGSAAGQGNVISGSTSRGIQVYNTSTGTTIHGNMIGVSATGAAALANSNNNIDASNTGLLTIGGPLPGAGNVISGSISSGIALSDVATGTLIQNNKIGTNAAGTADVGNGQNGISTIDTPGVTVKGNVISGNTETGILLYTASNSIIQGNKIGTNAAGTAGIGNSSHGLQVSLSSNVTIGGAGAGEGNLISANAGYGAVLVTATTSTFTYNRVGTTANGLGAMPNGTAGSGFAGLAMLSASTVTVANNLIAHQPDYSISMSGVGTDTTGTSTNNCLVDNGQGMLNNTGSQRSFTNNWWDSPTGPQAAANPGGTGDPASNLITLSPFLTAAPSTCSFLYGTPPALSSPKNGSAVAKTPAKLAWKKATGATSYVVQLDDGPDFITPIDGGSPTVTYFTTGSLAFGTYYWRVAMVGVKGTSEFSMPFSFELTVNKTPAKNAVTASHLSKFSWGAITGATEYTLQVYDDLSDCESTTGPLIDKPGLTKTSYSMVSPTDTALNFGTYYWHVRASAGTTTAYAPCWPFDVSTLKSPKDNSIVANFLPKFSWGKNAAASGYTIAARKLNDDSTTTTVLNDFPVTLASYTALPGDGFTYGHYKWHITEVGSSFGNPTPDFEFFITNMSKPLNNTFTTDTTPSFSWKKITGATNYTLELAAQADPEFMNPVLVIDTGTTLKTTVPASMALARGVYWWRVRVTGTTSYTMPPWALTVGP